MSKHAGCAVNKFGQDQTGNIVYKFNKQGYRSDVDFDFVPDFAFFGCSLVFGVGVPVDKTFAYLFDKSQNYGMAGHYSNSDIFESLKNFLERPGHSLATKIAVVWHSRDPHNLEPYYQHLAPHKILHFFCGNPLPYKLCYPMIPNLDLDVSGTHFGPKSHRAFWRLLSNLFDQS